jgi:hypothetical protein
MIDPTVVRVHAFPQEMRNIDLLEEEWIPFFAAQDGPIRMITQPRRFDLRQPIARNREQLKRLETMERYLRSYHQLLEQWHAETPTLLHQLQAQTPERYRLPVVDLMDKDAWHAALSEATRPLWRLRWLQDERQMYDVLQNDIPLRTWHHYWVSWTRTAPEQVVRDVAQAFNTYAEEAELPPLLIGLYEEQWGIRSDDCYLAPESLDAPYVALLYAYDLAGVWDLYTLGRLLYLDADIHLCIDVDHVGALQAAEQTARAKTSTSTSIKLSSDGGHRRTHRKLDTALYIEEALDAGQALHDIRLIVAVSAPDLKRLNADVRQIIQAGGSRIKLVRPAGGQKDLAAFFGPTPSFQITSIAKAKREVTHAATCMVPFGYRKPEGTNGILTIIQGNDSPVFFDPVRDVSGGKAAGHMVVVGQTNAGKTFTSNVLALRLLEQGSQVVMIEPQGHSARLVRAAGRGGARYVLTMRESVNPLDIAVSADEHGNVPSLAEQVNLVITQLSTIMGQVVPTVDGKGVFQAKVWDAVERGLLDQGLTAVYAPWTQNLDTLLPAQTPLISDLCDAIASLQDVEGHVKTIRDQLASVLYHALVKTSQAATFNRHTTIDWDFTHDCTAFDFTAMHGVSSAQVVFTLNALGSLNRYVRSSTRDQTIPLYCFFDEAAYLFKNAPGLADWVALAFKTWRTRRAAGIVMDQDLHLFAGMRDGDADPALYSMLTNAPTIIVMRQEAKPAWRLKELFPGLQDKHIKTIIEAKRGMCVILRDSDDPNNPHKEVFVGRVVPTEREKAVFGGT